MPSAVEIGMEATGHYWLAVYSFLIENGFVVHGEVGDISRFSKASKLAAYAGIDAAVSQSGQFQSTNNKMSKRGSPFLRKAPFQAALVAAFHDPVFSTFYQKKRAEGKHHLIAIGAVARKLCNVIFTVFKNNEPFRLIQS